jgi:phosphoheptose isomerase
LLTAGNGGSAAEAQHLSSELVGRFAEDRAAFSSIALHTDSSAVTAIGNDYGFENLFARQVEAHARAGDVLLLLTTSGRSPNLLRAAKTARRMGVLTWALTGPGPNPLTRICDEAVAIEAASPNVQEAHLMAIHGLCLAFDAHIARTATSGATRTPSGEDALGQVRL